MRFQIGDLRFEIGDLRFEIGDWGIWNWGFERMGTRRRVQIESRKLFPRAVAVEGH